MRILHSSDWHLGQHFMGKTRQAEHQALIDWLLAEAQAQQVDAVLLAGDIFDTGTPPSYARELYNRLVLALKGAGVQLVVLAGNHDSVAMLEESKALLGALDTLVVASPGDDQLLVLKDGQGQPGAILCAIPFLRARDLLQSEAGQSQEDKQRGLQQAIQDHYQHLYQRALARRAELGLELPIVMTGHLTTVGASASESVREIYVGSLEAYPSNGFPPADYIALGHIHRPQKVGGQDHVRYSGSPIPLSFDEARQQKEVLLVELAPGQCQVSSLPVPSFQALASVRGRLEELRAQVAALCEGIDSLWLEVQLEGEEHLADLQARVAEQLEGLPVELLRLRRVRSNQGAALGREAGETLDELDPLDVFARRLACEELEPALADSLTGLYRQTLASLEEGQ
ncbi:exonuclease subunit SbcD [Gallaecimonas kandeliae]|uniref:exonuclease subunit SbcD n=1 Tax=Gallaecimonas kandeliae TaxID=3029055 RepID=UPI002648795A|nr:exonuclease subunit SbcD [Gallaecimonas kandeliae]WKE66193.1 exonuclease subunit SbcD [Gallaecimonas kandeliae]